MRTHYDDKDDQSPEKADSLDPLICYFDVLEEDIALERSLEKVMLFQISAWDWHKNCPLNIIALLLLQVDDKATETYRRVGMAEVPNVDGLVEEGLEMKDVCII